MLPNVVINLENGQLGSIVQYAEGVAGIMGTGTAVSGKIGLNDPRLVTKLADAVALGLDATNNPVAYRHISEFYAEAGDGAELYVMLVANTMDQTEMWDETNASGVIQLRNYAAGKIRIMCTFFTPPGGYSLVTTAGLDADVFTAIPNAQALAVASASAQTPFRAVIEGRAFTGTYSALTDLTTMTNNRVAVVIGGSANDGSSGVGQALGRLAAIPVQRKLSRIKDGPLKPTQMYVGSALVDSFSGLDVMHDKGYIVPRTFPNVTGYFWGSDHTATADTDDYSSLARGRVIDKASALAYATYVVQLDDDIDINTDGTLPMGVIKYLESIIEQQINGSMTAAQEISSVSAYINPAQNTLSSNKLNLTLSIVPKGYNTEIDVDLGFDNPSA